MAEAMPFDVIKILENQAWKEISLQDWLKIDVQKRVEFILKRGVQFMSKGTPIPTSNALESIKKLSAG